MNDEFEKKLRTLTGALHRPDPVAAWKSDILSRARREAEAKPLVGLRPPRVLLYAWAAGWAIIALMSLATPRNSVPRTASPVEARAGQTAAVNREIDNSPRALLAFNHDLP